MFEDPNIGVLLVSIVVTVLVFLYAINFGRSPAAKTLSEFFLMGRRGSRWMIGLSYTASMISALLFIGLPGMFYTHGIGAWLYICLPVMFAVLMFKGFGTGIRALQVESNAVSPFEAIGFAYKSRYVGALAFLITAIFVVPVIAMQLVGIGRLLEPFGIEYHIGIFVLVVGFVLYTIFAGMRGDVRTDILQGGLMLFGILFIGYAVVQANNGFGGGSISERLLSVPGPNGLYTVPRLLSVGIMMGALILGHGHYIMRFMIARDDREIERSMPIAAITIFLLYSGAAVVGIVGAELFPGLSSGDQLMGAILSNGFEFLGGLGLVVSGLILACVFASALSSVDSQFLALGAAGTRDVLKAFFGVELSERAEFRAARVFMGLIGLAALMLALNPPALIVQLAVFAASGTMCLVPTFVGAAVLRKKPSGYVAMISISAGFGAFIYLSLNYGADVIWGWHPGIFALVISTVLYGIASIIPTRNARD